MPTKPQDRQHTRQEHPARHQRNAVELENIEGRRLQAGIDDVALRAEIRGLHVGDMVKITFLTGASTSETLLVRITSIRGATFRGKLADSPASPTLSGLHPGSLLAFTTDNIHSLPRGPMRER